MELQPQQLHLNKTTRLQLKKEAKRQRISMSKLAEDLIISGLKQLKMKSSQSTLSDLENLHRRIN
tara:strand:+ start:3468 stop:3662 length:195 start_codon:yes stop_codon:yes gene_type:complete